LRTSKASSHCSWLAIRSDGCCSAGGPPPGSLRHPPEQQHVARQHAPEHPDGGLKHMHPRIYVKVDVLLQKLDGRPDVGLAVHQLRRGRGWPGLGAAAAAAAGAGAAGQQDLAG
jgi:hypothetical protein